MKTPSQWRETYPDLFEHTINLIQQDAFESGRVYGLKLAAHQDRCKVGTKRSRELFEYSAKEHELAAATPNPLKSPSL